MESISLPRHVSLVWSPHQAYMLGNFQPIWLSSSWISRSFLYPLGVFSRQHPNTHEHTFHNHRLELTLANAKLNTTWKTDRKTPNLSLLGSHFNSYSIQNGRCKFLEYRIMQLGREYNQYTLLFLVGLRLYNRLSSMSHLSKKKERYLLGTITMVYW